MGAIAESVQEARRVLCGHCASPVIEVPLRGGCLPILLDLPEVLPQMQCPVCRSARLRDYSICCWRCGDSKLVGEPMAGRGGAIGEDGLARPVDLAHVELGPGEAVHRAHRC